MNKFQYIRAGEGYPDDAYEIECDFGASSWRYVARACADDFFHNHDGNEANWPLDLEIFTEGGQSLGVFEIYMEYEPSFTPSKKPDPTKPAGAGG